MISQWNWGVQPPWAQAMLLMILGGLDERLKRKSVKFHLEHCIG